MFDKEGKKPRTDFVNSSWYCAHCPLIPEADEYVNKYQLAQHILAVHGEPEAKDGVDYYQGWHARKKLAARKHVAEAVSVAAFADPNYGPEDFLADAGPDAPEEPPCDPVKREEKSE